MELDLIRAGNDKKHTVFIEPQATVSDLTLRASSITNCPFRTIRLFFSGRELKPPAAKLASFHVGQNGCRAIHMTTKVVEICGEEAPPPLGFPRPSNNRSQSTSSSGTLVDLTDGVPVTTDNWIRRSASRSATPRSDCPSASIDLTENDSPAENFPSVEPVVAVGGRHLTILPGEREVAVVAECPRKVAARLRRLNSQRLYCLDQNDKSTPGNAGSQYSVMGSGGAMFEVVLSKSPSCTCQDAIGPNAVLPCKHLVFVMVKVLKIDSTSALIYQTGFLQTELAEMLDQSRTSFHRNSFGSCSSQSSTTRFSGESSSEKLAGGVEEVWDDGRSFLSSGILKHFKGKSSVYEVIDDEEKREESKESAAAAELFTSEPDVLECPICFDVMATSVEKETVDPDNRRVVSCAKCRGTMHSDCITVWLKQKSNCPFCRATWKIQKATNKRRGAATRGGRRGRPRIW